MNTTTYTYYVRSYGIHDYHCVFLLSLSVPRRLLFLYASTPASRSFARRYALCPSTPRFPASSNSNQGTTTSVFVRRRRNASRRRVLVSGGSGLHGRRLREKYTNPSRRSASGRPPPRRDPAGARTRRREALVRGQALEHNLHRPEELFLSDSATSRCVPDTSTSSTAFLIHASFATASIQLGNHRRGWSPSSESGAVVVHSHARARSSYMSLAWKNVHSVTSSVDRTSSARAARQSERSTPWDAQARRWGSAARGRAGVESVCARLWAFISPRRQPARRRSIRPALPGTQTKSRTSRSSCAPKPILAYVVRGGGDASPPRTAKRRRRAGELAALFAHVRTGTA